jgi:hypothetical protein
MQRTWWVVVTFSIVACGGSSPAPIPPANRSTGQDPAPSRPEAGSPYDPAVWIAKLPDPRERERAINELEQLGNPIAIEPLGKVWLEDRSPRPLQVLISLARPLTAAEAKSRFITDYEASGRSASWHVAGPILIRALAEIDPANPRSVDSATKAAEALGEAQLSSGVEALLAMARRAPDKKTVTAQISAIRALAKQGAAKATVAPALGKLIDVDPPRHPRMAKSKDEGRALEEGFGLHLAMTGAMINALGELGAATEIKSLILAVYRTPELARQLRRALVAVPARDALLEVLAGKHAAVERLFTAKKLGRYCGDRGELPDAQCQPVSLRDFYAALLLGDAREPRAVPLLLEALKRPAAPAYYIDEQPGPTQYQAIFDALRKIGSADAAAPLRAIWMERQQDLATRIGAIEAYGFVVRDATGRAELAKIAADNIADDGLRQAAAVTLARISSDAADIKVFLNLAGKYLDASAKQRKEASAQQATVDAAERRFAPAKQKFDATRAALEAVTKDPNASADDIRKATAAARSADDAYKLAKRAHKDAIAPFRAADQAARAYLGYARMFQTHVARIEIAMRCKVDLGCYAQSLRQNPDQATTQVASYVKDASTWSKDEKVGILEGAIERAMLELGKRGGQGQRDALLDATSSDNRVIRQSILLALPKIAQPPCTACVAKLDAALKSGEGKSSLGDLDLETAIVRAYFMRVP